MKLRQSQGYRPQITFTSDFHELVEGDLIAGPCVLRYDPLRLVELEEAGSTSHQIRAHVRFHPGGTEWQGTLLLPSGLPLAQLADPCGQGIMLETTFTIPPGCDELEAWFSCTHPDGHTHWDSDHGKNHWLRFGLADLTIKLGKVTAVPGGLQDSFAFECTTPAKVENVSLRWRLPSVAGSSRQSTPLVCTSSAQPVKTWASPAGGIPVPAGATVVYDVCYTVGGRSYTDDNQGRWYVAD